ncbi:hypothetical protein HDU96_008365, partial [Phlyctochytrium bullatum]
SSILTTAATLALGAPPESSSSLPIAAIAGGSTGVVALLTAALVAVFFLRKRRQASLAALERDLSEEDAPSVPIPPPKPDNVSFSDENTPKADHVSFSDENIGPSSAFPPDSAVPVTPDKSAAALFSGLNQSDVHQQQHPEPRPPSTDKDPSVNPVFDFIASVKKPETSKEAVAPVRGASLQRAAPMTASPPQTGEISRVVSSGGLIAERQARSRIATLSPAELGERLMRMGVGAGLVSALEENNIDGANLLLLTDADLVAMGIKEWYSRDLVLRKVANLVTSEKERVEQGLTASTGRLDRLPTYAP